MPLLPRLSRLLPVVLAGTSALPAAGAYVSELFQSGPAGQAVELTAVDDAMGATLAILNGSRFDAGGFGQVLEVIHLPADAGWSPVVHLTDAPWPGGTVPATPLADLNPASGSDTFLLGTAGFDRLLVVFDGVIDLQLGDSPLNDVNAAARYDATAVTDWLAIGPAGLGSAYQTNGYDLDHINATLGIDLLDRIADRSAGQVLARTHAPGQPLDLNQAWVGDPDANGRFDVGGGLAYRITPGLANVPLIDTVPEPGTLAGLLIGLAVWGRCHHRR